MELGRFTKVFKALSDGTRLRIVWVLDRAGTELCVCEIIDSLEETQYNVSRQMKILKEADLVQERKEGRWVFYSLKNPESTFLKRVLGSIRSLSGDTPLRDGERLKARLSLRENGKCVVGMCGSSLTQRQVPQEA